MADTCLASFLSSGRADFSFLPPRNSFLCRPVGSSLRVKLRRLTLRFFLCFRNNLSLVIVLALLFVRLRLWRSPSGLSLRPCLILCGSFPGCLASFGFRILLRRILPFSIRWPRPSLKALPISLRCVLPTRLSWSLSAGSFICHTCLRTFRTLTRGLCWLLRRFARTSCSPRLMSPACCRTLRPLRLCDPNRPWWMWPRARLVHVLVAPASVVFLLGSLRLAAAAESPSLLLVAGSLCGSTPLLLTLL